MGNAFLLCLSPRSGGGYYMVPGRPLMHSGGGCCVGPGGPLVYSEAGYYVYPGGSFCIPGIAIMSPPGDRLRGSGTDPQ